MGDKFPEKPSLFESAAAMNLMAEEVVGISDSDPGGKIDQSREARVAELRARFLSDGLPVNAESVAAKIIDAHVGDSGSEGEKASPERAKSKGG